MPMTPDAKRALSTTIRALRARLLQDLHAATESAYRLSIRRTQDAGLDAAAATKRRRLEAWIAEQERSEDAKGKAARSREEFRAEAEKEAAYTLLNRLVILRLMEAPGHEGKPLRAPAVVTGGWESRAYQDFRQLAPALVREDESEGYAFLLRLVFEDLAGELPGLYGPVGVADLIPIPTATLRHVIEELDKPDLASCWTDDMTLGWVYQYWNDPAREALDEMVKNRHSIQRHEIASKTQMFTDRYMVDWLLQNSLGPMWLAMCKKHGWTPAAEADGTLQRLEERRAEWRAKREAGEVSLTDLMPLHTDMERRWAYYVPQPIPADAVTHAPDSVRTLKLLDPAVGSGHFLLVALTLLVALYHEEAHHRGEDGQPQWTDRAIVERILSHNLHGIDLDPRAVQIAAAALWIKARQIAADAQPERLNLVASNLRLAALPDDDPALVELRREVEKETGIPARLTDTIVQALRGADHLGSLLKVNQAVDQALDRFEAELAQRNTRQTAMFEQANAASIEPVSRSMARATLLERLDLFLERHTAGDDVGLRLRGEQLAAGVRFVRMIREGTYDLVVANPPYHSAGKLAANASTYQALFPIGHADLFTAFILRTIEFLRDGGISATVTLSNWMFLNAFREFREHMLSKFQLSALGDLGKGSFSSGSKLISASTQIFRKQPPCELSIAVRPYKVGDTSTDSNRVDRNTSALLYHVGRHEFDPAALRVVPGWPLVYWWDHSLLESFQRGLLGAQSPVRQGLATSNNDRFLRRPWEVRGSHIERTITQIGEWRKIQWVPFVKGAQGRAWFEPLDHLLEWNRFGITVKLFNEWLYGSYTRTVKNEAFYFLPSVSFTTIGDSFAARLVRFPSAFDVRGSCVITPDTATMVVRLNTRVAKTILESLNPGVNFQVGDVNRLPLFPVSDATSICSTLDAMFSTHESHREPSVEFIYPGPSPWRYAQEWAQTAVERPEGAPLPPYEPIYDPEPPTDHLSFALGVALGRFGPHGEGILDPAKDDLAHALPHGILFLDGTLDAGDYRDSLGHPAAAHLHAAWQEYGPAIQTKKSLRPWLAEEFFKDVHKGMYENRPIHWPLSSAAKTFVAWVNIHRFTAQTLTILLADHLVPTRNRIHGELTDLRAARDGADKKAARAAEQRYSSLLKARDELDAFIDLVTTCAQRGAPPTDAKCPARQQDAVYAPDLDDGVMINSAALWPLLEPQWKDPKKWWKELCTASGRKDYDWSHLAMRYWPTRVDAKCQADPSLGVAHGCFWRYHPARAWAWELRLQDEIAPDFRIQEAPYRPGGRPAPADPTTLAPVEPATLAPVEGPVGLVETKRVDASTRSLVSTGSTGVTGQGAGEVDTGDGPHRDAWLRDHPKEALDAVEKEAQRRMGRGKDRRIVAEMPILERGLWSVLPTQVWDMELRLAEKQRAEFRLLSPDEPEARAAYEEAFPERVKERAEFLDNLEPLPGWFDDADQGSDDEDDVDYGSDDDDTDDVGA